MLVTKKFCFNNWCQRSLSIAKCFLSFCFFSKSLQSPAQTSSPARQTLSKTVNQQLHWKPVSEKGLLHSSLISFKYASSFGLNYDWKRLVWGFFWEEKYLTRFWEASLFVRIANSASGCQIFPRQLQTWYHLAPYKVLHILLLSHPPKSPFRRTELGKCFRRCSSWGVSNIFHISPACIWEIYSAEFRKY